MDWIRGNLEFLFRWIHVVAGIMWIGHLYFFNFVNSQVAKAYDPDSKKKILPELMPRALYWFRWGAAYTWFSGVFLLAFIYYSVPAQISIDPANSTTAIAISLAAIVVSFFIYDALWKMMKNEMAGVVISYILIVAILFGLHLIFPGRTLFIHMGGLFGTIMMMNVWMRIWPAQKKIIAGVKGTGPAPDASVAAMAGLRSKQNTYMSVPLVFFMVSNHYPTLYGSEYNWAIAAGIILVGWIVTKWFYIKTASATPMQIGDQK
jgi:uncharacterized membrane protein